MQGELIRIGVTGDVGSGKSSLRRWLGVRGAATIDADKLAHRVLERPDVTRLVARRFGDHVLNARQEVDRAALARIVFADAEALSQLEAILHPGVLEATDIWLAEVASTVAVVEAVKLVETGMQSRLDQLWLVLCAEPERRRRLRSRDWSDVEISRRIAAAPPLAPRLAAADVVIDNSASWAHTERQIEWAARGLDLPGGDL